jgi:hypothetical protein
MRRKQVTHPVNVTYLVIGLVFLAISGSWALRTAGAVDTRQFGWVVPLMLVAIGGVGLVASTARGIRRRDPDETDEVHDTDSPEVADPIPTYSFGIDALEEKLERAARSGSTTSTDLTDQPGQPDQRPGDQRPPV